MRPDKITALGVARTFQNIRLFATMSALENVMVGQHARMKAGLFGSILRTPAGAAGGEGGAREGARDARLRRAATSRELDQIATNLSYGDQRRVEIARALASDPKLLLLDEPTAGMNPQESARLTEFMGRLRDERGLTILLIEHDMKVVMGVSEQHHRARPRREDRRGRAAGGPRRTSAWSRPTSESGSLSDGAARGRRHPHLLRQHRGAEGHLAHGGGGRGRHAHRLQRRRQVHHAALDLRADPAARGLDPLRGQGDRRDRAAGHRAAGDLAVARGAALLPAHDRAREPRAGRLPAPRRAGHRTTSTACSTSSRGSRSASARRRARCPAASSRCSRSAAR